MADLARRALAEDFRAIDRLVNEFRSGRNRFDRPGEALFCARQADRLVGCCGLNSDPYANDPALGRVRRLYVHPDQRRRGIARALIAAVEDSATGTFEHLQLYTGACAAAAFYEALGYARIIGVPRVSHRKSIGVTI
jgi:N-acetylglutamate synthase-like GNAT family acetyltransferase